MKKIVLLLMIIALNGVYSCESRSGRRELSEDNALEMYVAAQDELAIQKKILAFTRINEAQYIEKMKKTSTPEVIKMIQQESNKKVIALENNIRKIETLSARYKRRYEEAKFNRQVRNSN